MNLFLTVLHVMACLVLIVVVLLQRGKGADIGAVFGSGASTTVFGSRGAGNFFTKLTTGAVITFFLTSLAFNYFSNQERTEGLFDNIGNQVEQPAPAKQPAATPNFEEIPAPDAPSTPQAK